MDITPTVAADRQLINGYGDLGFTITGLRHEGSVLVFPDRTLAWPVSEVGQIDLDSLKTVIDANPGLLLLGTGKGMALLPKELRASLRQAGLVVECMDTGAACRTYNVLLTEGREVAAALIAV